MSDSTGLTKLEAQYTNGEWQAKVDNLTSQDVAFFEELKPKIQEKLNSTSSVEQKRQVLRQEYERLRGQINADPNLREAGMEKVDIAVAMRVIKEAVESGKSDNLLNRVGGVLSQSDHAPRASFADRLREWKQSMPESEYQAQAKAYIVNKFEQASQIRASLLAERDIKSL